VQVKGGGLNPVFFSFIPRLECPNVTFLRAFRMCFPLVRPEIPLFQDGTYLSGFDVVFFFFFFFSMGRGVRPFLAIFFLPPFLLIASPQLRLSVSSTR